MATFKELCDLARLSMQDTSGVRIKDTPELIGYANIFMRVGRRFRRAAFFGTPYFSGGLPTFALGDPFPLPSEYEPGLVDYLIARAAAKDDEFNEDGKVLAFFGSSNALTRGK